MHWAEHGPRGWVAVPVSPCPCVPPLCAARAPLRPGEVAAHTVAELPARGRRAPVTPGPTALLFQARRPGPLRDRGASGEAVRESCPIHAAAPAALTHGFRESWQCPGPHTAVGTKRATLGARVAGPWGRGGHRPRRRRELLPSARGPRGAPVRPLRPRGQGQGRGDAAPQLLPVSGHSEQGPDGAHT